MATSGSFEFKIEQFLWMKTYGVFSWSRSSYSVSDNTSTISWTLKVEGRGGGGSSSASVSAKAVVNGYSYSGSKNVDIGLGGEATVISGTTTVKHNSSGEATFSASASIEYTPGSTYTGSGSSSFTLDSIPVVATITDADNFDDEENPTVWFSNPTQETIEIGIADASSSFLVSYRTVTSTASSYTFTLTDTERSALRRSIRTGRTATVRFYLRTTISGNYYYKYVSRTLTLINHEPTLDPTIPIDTNSVTVALTGDDSILVRFYSNAYVETGAEAQKEATIASQYIINGSTTVNEGSATFNGIESNTFYYSVTDSRGFTTRDAVVVDLVPYFKPTISLSVLPFSLAGDLTFTLKGKYFNNSFGARSNSFAVSYIIVESGQSLSTATYQNVPRSASTISGDDYTTNYTISGLDPNKSYQLMVRIQDSLDASYASRQSIAASPIFDWSRTDFNFNVPIYLKDTEIPLENLKDYVVLQGESGDWFYRLWYSGKVELFGTKGIYGTACNLSLGNWYRTVVLSSPAFPFTVNNPIVTVNYESDGYGAVVWPTTQTTTSKPFDFYLIRPTSSTGITGKLTYHVIGDLGGVIA